MTEQLPVLEDKGEAYENLVRHVPHPLTRMGYLSQLKKFAIYCEAHSYNDLLFGGDTRKIETKIEDFLILLQGRGFASSSVLNCKTAIAMFYQYNRVTNLNWRIMSKVLRPFRKASDDRPYTKEEISKILESTDQRGKIVALLMASSGVRIGAIHSLILSHLEKMEGDVYKITVYKNDPEEYYTFCSPECAKAIDDYLLFRKRCGELLKPYHPLIRKQFNKDSPEQAAKPKPLGPGRIEDIIYRAVNDSGIREKKNIIKGQKKYMHEVMQSHGLRKYFDTQITIGEMNQLYAEMLMGHKDGLQMKSYVKPTVSKMLEEYLKVVDYLTINEENKLKREVKELKGKMTDIEEMRLEMKKIRELVGIE